MTGGQELPNGASQTNSDQFPGNIFIDLEQEISTFHSTLYSDFEYNFWAKLDTKCMKNEEVLTCQYVKA